MSKFSVDILVCTASVLVLACDDSISPLGSFQPRMAAYSILTTTSDTQYVRVYSSYTLLESKTSFNPEETSVNDATVTVTDGTNTYTFSLFSIPQPNTGWDTNKIGLYYAYPFRPQENKEYTLKIVSPTMGEMTSKTRVPGKGTIECYTLAELYGGSNQPVAALFTLSDFAKAYLVRLYMVYTAENPWEPEDTRSKEKYYEVPAFWKILNLNLEQHQKEYPKPTRRTSPVNRRDQTLYFAALFPYPTRQESVYEIVHYNFNARFKRAVFYLVQFDEAWYRYYASTNLFQDKLSVRLDPPDYSNVQGGYGLFGSFRVDSTVIPLPEYIQPYR